ncbi:MAG: bifunctional methylenetetrahydrofolate dehydrogenase/methenyltetrahydrofolate cyclohydrolase FolD [Ignavibacteria bacterium]|jgi:methylenetetrahydrofolate dehydrogenase (NADP+)/methenyltetrahydrofolate cyclohydrolase|nr:bifunctional methylenetetrahydrofolate dehydrogenase/methenyltetrahydrofolate cyclohydrolase FolD [Ignavibacteria bacterium]MCU7500463.1 bifunctional methylenetetrahydrofolate dehydrogenase/methenyltetrahydrofolate cyclohydrolase FolD [Ignavibacteria bacterium]MCU7511862.1 bifunctional methylenetetrahydrofolate dehydrogenase/methenyltetrahydrofolate cyclohydrolase FolD [Ignavibacteria bacterium]MCU7519937.1 bifunctional methylenetetrahydrofolate dehydrogenase/methenyltetrahydrofolate cyclohyd
MNLIDGKKVASEIKEELKKDVSRLKEEGRRVPGLVTILVGDSPASQSYVKSKVKSSGEVGMVSKLEKLDESTSEDALLEMIDSYNRNNDFDGILVQLPLPGHINEDKVINAILPEKDVDGFHPINVGRLVIGQDTLYPCTPAGVQELLKYYKIETKGKHVVVVGRSNIVGKPVSNIMLQKKPYANAIVTVCHSAAKDLTQYTKSADILIAAIGKANFITAEMVKNGVVVVDVGINRVPDDSPKGYRIVGDVDFESVAPKSSYITPVPGGVGAMTIAMLLKNTYKAYLMRNKS